MMETNRTASSLFLTSDLVWRVHARANVERETRTATLLSRALRLARGHFRFSRKRDIKNKS